MRAFRLGRPAPTLAVASARRTLVYVRDGQLRARGFRKDPETYMSNPAGVQYPGDPALLAPAREFLGKWALPDPLVLQSLTHKSFAHGKKPYNEKLAILGQELLRVQAWRAALEALGTQDAEPALSQRLVNGHNFDVNQRAVELLASTTTLARVAELAGLLPSLFWKPADAQGHGGHTVYAKAVSALIGGVLLEHGATAAMDFVSARLLQGPFSVFDLANQSFRSEAAPKNVSEGGSKNVQ